MKKKKMDMKVADLLTPGKCDRERVLY